MAAQLYRGSTVGTALTDALDEMVCVHQHDSSLRLLTARGSPQVTEGMISPAVAMKVLEQVCSSTTRASLV